MSKYYETEKLLAQIDDRFLTPSYIRDYYKVHFVYNGSAFAGNCLTKDETSILLKKGLDVAVEVKNDITINNKPIRNHLEVLGYSDAFDQIFKIAKSTLITKKDIVKLHKVFYIRINKEEAGEYRKIDMSPIHSQYLLPSAEEIPEQMNRFLKRIEFYQKNLHPVEYGAKALKEFLFICPFADGNGRIAQLLLNLILFQHKYPLCIITPNLRNEFDNALEKSHIDERVFFEFIISLIKQSIRDFWDSHQPSNRK